MDLLWVKAAAPFVAAAVALFAALVAAGAGLTGVIVGAIMNRQFNRSLELLKASQTAEIERLRAELKELGDARHLRIRAIYEREFDATRHLLDALGTIQGPLGALDRMSRSESDPSVAIDVILELSGRPDLL